MSDEIKGKEVKSVSLKGGESFMANGHKYYVSQKICIARFREFEKLEPLLTYGVGFKEIWDAMSKNYKALNDRRFADAAVITHNIMSGIKDAIDSEKRIHPSLLMAALVINREDEDATVFNQQLQEEKIQDWTLEGLNIIDFFTSSLTSIRGFRETYLEYIQQQAKELVIKSDLMQE